MIINIPTTKRKFFRQALEIMKAIPPINKLRPKELDVLAELLYYNYIYGHIEENLRGKVVFDYDTKITIREYLDINETNFNNILTILRKKGILIKRSITNDYGINPDKPNITFKFNLLNEEDNKDN